MSTAKRKVVLIGCGTFNPPTLMHLRMFELARDCLKKRLNYDEVEGIISPVNDNYRNITSKFILDSSHRCNMVKLALKALPPMKSHWVRLDDWEIKQAEWMRTLQVLKHHHEEINRTTPENSKKVPLMLLCGADMFDSFNIPGLWKDEDIEKILSTYGMVVITREGNNPWETLSKSSKSPIIMKHKNNIHIVEEKVKNMVSSSYVREALGKGETVRYLIDDSVLEYIHKHNLYSSTPAKQ